MLRLRHAGAQLRRRTALLSESLAGFSRLAAPAPTIAFSFDIDGVLIRGGKVLEPARRALSRLYAKDGAAANA